MKASDIAKGGLYAALSFILVYLSAILPTSKLYILGIASALIPLSILTTNIKNSLLVYIVTSLLCFLFIGPKGTVFAYIFLFGLYGFVKLLIEKIRKAALEFLLKFAFFNFSFFSLLFFYKTLFTNITGIPFPFYILFLFLQIVFVIYDYALTVFIGFTQTRFKYLKKNN